MIDKIKRILLSSVVGVIVVGVVSAGVVLAATKIVNQFYGNVTLNQEVVGGEVVGNAILGGVEAPDPGLCSNGDPYANLCAVAIHGPTNYGGVTALTPATSTTLTAAQVCDNTLITVEPTVDGQNITLTLPTVADLGLDCLQSFGDSRHLVIKNATTGSPTITIVLGTGMDIQEPDGQNVVIASRNYAWLDLIKIDATDMVVKIDETIPAD